MERRFVDGAVDTFPLSTVSLKTMKNVKSVVVQNDAIFQQKMNQFMSFFIFERTKKEKRDEPFKMWTIFLLF